jgi:Domain of unknown function (DU1801)
MSSSLIESQIEGFIAKYSPGIAADLRVARENLRTLFPRGFELVFDNYNALVFGISPTERSSEAFISVAGYPRWLTLFFLRGAELEDPEGLLEGSGKQVRSIRINTPRDIGKPSVMALIAQASRPYEAAFKAAPMRTTIIKTIVAKQRARRPVSKTKLAPAR